MSTATKLILKSNYDEPKEGWIVFDGYRYYLRDEDGIFNARYGQINFDEHRDLNTLVHEITQPSYDEVIYGGGTLGDKISMIITWNSSSKEYKLRQSEFTYLNDDLVKTVETAYNKDGIVTERITESYSYSGDRIISVERTRNV